MADLQALFAPERVAVIGATPRPGSIGRALLANLRDGFGGSVVAVNPGHDAVLGTPCVPTVAEAGAVDLAVVAVPAAAVPDVLREAAAAGVQAVVVISAGFAEADARGAALEREISAVAEEADIALVGPNSVGVMSPAVGLNATFAPTSAHEGSISMLSQSGAFVTAAVDWASDRGIGFRHVVSLGNEAVLSETDLLAYWADEPGTDVVVGYVEGIDEGRPFIDTARAVTRDTPVVLLKAGRSAAGARAAASHTGTLAGSDRAYRAAFEQAGVVRAGTVEELFDVGTALAAGPESGGDAVGVVTNAGGPGVLASDALEASALTPAAFDAETRRALRSIVPGDGDGDPGNPVDLIGDADADRFRRALDAVLADPGVDAALVCAAPTALLDFEALAEAIATARAAHDLPIVACLMGGTRVEPATARLQAGGVASTFDPARAVRHLEGLAEARRLATREDGEPLAFDVDESAVEAILDRALDRPDGRVSVEGTPFLRAIGVPTPDGDLAVTPAEAAAIARGIDGPLVLKVASPDVLHKSDLGGVELGVAPGSVRDAFERVVDRVREADPTASIEGVWVEAQVDVDGGIETIVGVNRDPQFGPLVMFGLGGIYVQVYDDVAFRVAPVSEPEARELTAELRAAELLRGARGRPVADLDAVVEAIGRIAHVAVRYPAIRELDVNPLLATPDGVVALDFRLRAGHPDAGESPDA